MKKTIRVVKTFKIVKRSCSLIRDHPFKTSAIFHWFLTPTPYRRQFFSTIRRQIWQIFDPSPPKACRRLKWMVPNKIIPGLYYVIIIASLFYWCFIMTLRIPPRPLWIWLLTISHRLAGARTSNDQHLHHTQEPSCSLYSRSFDCRCFVQIDKAFY